MSPRPLGRLTAHCSKIPATIAKFILPPLFLFYLVSFALEVRSVSRNAPQTKKSETVAAKRVNGWFSTDSLRRVLYSHDTPTLPLRLSAIGINVFLLLCTIDFTLRPVYESHSDLIFTRVGAVEPTQVKIFARYPNITDGLRILYRPSPAPANETGIWITGPTIDLNQEQDWTGVTKLRRLTPSSSYECMFSVGSDRLPECPRSISFRCTDILQLLLSFTRTNDLPYFS